MKAVRERKESKYSKSALEKINEDADSEPSSGSGDAAKEQDQDI